MRASRSFCQRLFTVGFLNLLLLGAMGCGGSGDQAKTASVTGMVLYKGEPVPMGTVMFTPVAGGPPATGEIQSDGSFVMQTYVAGDGAVIGEHSVIVTAIQPASGLPEDADSGQQDLRADSDDRRQG
jgi:hypothetical protein